MLNFEYYVPNRIIFGKDTHTSVGKLIKGYGFKKVLLHYGGKSAEESGLIGVVKECLEKEGIEIITLKGVRANPELSLAREGIRLCIENQVDFILAVGGGSVIDSAKCIADGAANPGVDVWKYFTFELPVPKKALPFGVILTLAASGSEMSGACVITNEKDALKRGLTSETHRSLFSICNPELTYSVNKFQTACGTVDIIMHTLERYFGPSQATPLTDRIAEGLVKTVIEAGETVYTNPYDYDARAALMWAGSLSHNDLTSCGRTYMMQVHHLEHEISGLYPDIAHGAGLSALWASWARFVCESRVERFAQYAVRMWNVEMDFEDPKKTAYKGIRKTEEYFKSLNMPVSLRELGIKEEELELLAEKCSFKRTRTIKGIVEIGKDEMLAIYRLAMKGME
ncbi:MAG: iron-containing alcohol dehydrogenase [Clostridiaceae bacterium]|nr:iron-containing alcohol dehydrogenase [Clostridiaceae bacterium]